MNLWRASIGPSLPNWSLETRYARKRLDRTIEDMSITDNLGFYIGNPGSQFADLLHRPTVIPDANGNNYLNTRSVLRRVPDSRSGHPPLRRPGIPPVQPCRRGNWFGAVSYTYSKLTGNYAGLTNTDPTDGGGGRHAPNNGRAFDLPTMTYLPSGKIDDGPLATDRPNTGKVLRLLSPEVVRHRKRLIGLITVGLPGHSDQHLPPGSRHVIGLPVGGRTRQLRALQPRCRTATFSEGRRR